MTYGCWITHEGELVVVKDQCAHTRIKPYGEADDEGWIAVA